MRQIVREVNRLGSIKLLLGISLLLGGCAPQDLPTATVTATETQLVTATTIAEAEITATLNPVTVTNSPIPTLTSPPTATAVSDTPPPAPTATPQPVPTQTSRPSRTPTATLAAQIPLPAWINDPDTAVLLIFGYELGGSSKEYFRFINAPTGEQFDLKLAPRYGHAAWGQDENGLYFDLVRYSGSRSDGFHDRIYIADGAAVRLPIQPLTATPLPSSAKPTASGWAVTIDEDAAGKPAFLTNNDGETVLPLEDPFNGRYAEWVNTGWSANGMYLFVQRGQSSTDGPTLSDTIIYNTDGQIIATYENATLVSWSPTDDQLLLYTDTINDNKPCIANVTNGQIDCDGITLWREENNVYATQYNWLGDGNAIYFTYRGVDDNRFGFCLFQLDAHNINCPLQDDREHWSIRRVYPLADTQKLAMYLFYNKSEVEQGTKAICIYDGASGEFNCPVDETDLDPQAYIHFTDWSPNGRYIALTLHDGCPGCDDRTNALLMLADTEENEVKPYGFVYYRRAVYWRP